MISIPHQSIAAIGRQISPLIENHALRSFRSMLTGPGVRHGRGFVSVVTGEQNPFGNFLCAARDLDLASMTSAIAPLVGCGAPSAILFCGAIDAHTESALDANGFKRSDGITAQAVNVDEVAACSLPNGYVFARANDPAERAAWADVFARAYSIPFGAALPFTGPIGVQTAPDASVQYFWILKGDQPVCTSVLSLDDGVAGLYAIATVADERGKGLGAFATAEPLRVARALGFRVGVLQATQAGLPVYRRLGFRDFGELPLYLRMTV